MNFWVYANGSESKMCTDGTSHFVKKKSPTNGRYIILHALTWNGFISGTILIFISGTKLGDYQDSMNAESFEHWMLNQLLTNLEAPPVIVMDNVPYHSVLQEETLTRLKEGWGYSILFFIQHRAMKM